MFLLLKTAIWITGALVVGNFLLQFAHYEVNWKYVAESRERCFHTLNECQSTVIREGTNNAKCELSCFEIGNLIQQQESDSKKQTTENN